MPNESMAGLATGWRFSATRTPISQAQESLDCWPLWTTSSPAVAPSGTRAMTNESEPMITGAPTSPMVTQGRSDFGEALPSNLQLAAGDGGGRGDPRNLGPGVG